MTALEDRVKSLEADRDATINALMMMEQALRFWRNDREYRPPSDQKGVNHPRKRRPGGSP